MEKIKQDLIDYYSLPELQSLAKYYQLPDNQSLNELLEAVAEANQHRQKANMLPELPHTIPIHEALVRGMSFEDAVNLCKTDKSFAQLCRQPLIWRTWAEAHPTERDGALIKAVENNKLVIVQGLLAGGANPAADNNDAIAMAGENGHTEVVKLLLADPRVNPAAVDNWAVETASDNGHTEIVKLLLADPRVDPAAGDNYAIRFASRNGRIGVVKLLLADSRVVPAADDNYAIRWASENGHSEIVKLLLSDPRVDPAARDNEAIRWASKGGHTEIVKLLLSDPRVDPAADPRTEWKVQGKYLMPPGKGGWSWNSEWEPVEVDDEQYYAPIEVLLGDDDY